MRLPLAASARRVRDALSVAGLSARVVELPQSTRTAREAAAVIGCRVEQIAKSLVFRRSDTGQAVLVIASGVNRVDERLVAQYLLAEVRKTPQQLLEVTGGHVLAVAESHP